MRLLQSVLLFAIGVVSTSISFAQDGPVRPDLEARRLAPPSDSIAALGNDLFGESVDKYTGQTTLSASDIELPGNSQLPVKLLRSYEVQEPTGFKDPVMIGGWRVEVPVIEGTFSPDGWIVEGSSPNSRCSQGSGVPPSYEDAGVSFPVRDFWHGYTLRIPGQSDRQVLLSTASTPNKTQASRWTTKDNWLIDCLPSLKNGGLGEGFVATSPAGEKFFFDLMIVNSSPFQKTGIKQFVTELDTGGSGFCKSSVRKTTTVCTIIDLFQEDPFGSIHELDGGGQGGGSCAMGMGILEPRSYWDGGSLDCLSNSTGKLRHYARLERVSVHLVATRVEDRFGNYVNYNYDANKRLVSIQSNDTRQISLSYDSAGKISSASAHGRTWTYSYDADNALASVTLPDNKSWTYQGEGELLNPFFKHVDYDPEVVMAPVDECFYGSLSNIETADYGSSYQLKIKHPSGAVGSFIFTPRLQGKSNATDCRKMAIAQFSIARKFITGPGIAPAAWAFRYGPENSSLNLYTGANPDALATVVSCSLTPCIKTVATEITNPDATIERLVFGTDLMANEGNLLESKVFLNAIELSKTEYEYVPYTATNAGFTVKVGVNPSIETDNMKAERISPVKRVTFNQDGIVYTTLVNQFDAFARATDVTRSNSNGYSKTELMLYSDNTNKWVLGQLASQADAATSLIEQSNTYDPVTANLLSKSAFGVLQESYTYNTDGTLATVKDGKNNTYTLTSWKRGIPQLITAPNSTTQSGVVNDSGWLTSVTNQRVYTTGYSYDALGRLTGVTPPTGDTVVWAGTTLTFTPLSVATYGVPVGGWKHIISRGNYRKETFMDPLYRPLVIREYDNANVAGTERFTVKAYDTSNREVFSSYPGKTAGLTVGVRTEYDALGRVTKTKADSELGVLTTTTEYLSGGGIKVTGPDGNITTRTFRSLDAPSYEQMISEAAPGGVTTSISRDVFGKPLTLTRSGSDGLNISKQFAYDANQRLCMRTEPETGTSIIDYDAAGNVLWAANGQSVANATVCNRAAAVAGAKINYTYDALNRVTSTNVPNSTNDPTVTYLPDGTVSSLTNGTAKWEYTYNKLGKPVTEKLTLGTRTSTITHAYDTLANESSLTYPNGTIVTYAPNALGQATQAGTYATGISYRASGFLSAMTYGNGATYSAQPNLRGLPARRLDKKGTTVITDELMAYDQDANPVCVRDTTTGNPGHRDFTYDARDRLIKVSAPNQGWISSEYQYDSQDNLMMARLGTRQYNYSYNANNRLLDIGQPATAPTATNYGLLNCNDYALLAEIDSTINGVGLGVGGTGGAGNITITPLALSDGIADEPYSQTLTSSGGAAPYSYTLTTGSLPFGLSLAGGVISGTPRVEITTTFIITSTDSDGYSNSREYTLNILPGNSGCLPNDPNCNQQPFSVTPMLMAGDTLKYNFSHDANGRMTAKGAQAYVYDALNRMTQVTTKESYLYDGHGRRVQVTKTSDGKLNYPIYSLDGKLLLEDNRQTLKRTEYIYAGGRLVAKRIQPITSTGANNGAATTTTIHTDFLGSPVAETNSAGTVTRVERYTPYGEPADLQLDVGPGFTGHATDVATGLTYMQQRYYDAEIGRFISPDPVGPEEDFIQHFNRYNYAGNNPVKNVDPDGRAWGLAFKIIKVIAKGGDVAGTVAGAVSDAKTVFNSKATVGDRLIAGGSLLTEVFSPVSARDVKAAANIVEGVGDAKNAAKGTDFVVTPGGKAIPVPDNATGPTVTVNNNGKIVGFEYTGGSGGKGMDKRVDGVRVMDANQYQGKRAVYMNSGRHTVDPSTGKQVNNSSPAAHHTLEDDKK